MLSVFVVRTSGGKSSGCQSIASRLTGTIEGPPGTEDLALGAAQCAASNRPLPGAETALILYHRYLFGETPPGERLKPAFSRAFLSARDRAKRNQIKAVGPVGAILRL